MTVPKGRVAGLITIQANGIVLNAVGSFTYNLGQPKREYLVGPSGLQGYKELPQIGSIEGEIRDSQEIVITDILNLVDAVITLTIASGKIIMCSNAAYCADGNGETEEGNIEFKVEGLCEEIAP